MCGICGELRFDGREIDPRHVAGMADRLVHRGPDSSGAYMAPGARAAFGFRRLRVIDLSENGNQPMPNECGTVHVVFNGEIYNFNELRSGLVARGHRFRSHADTEVIVHLYEEKGAASVADLDGMFAIAVWDEREKRLTIARDRAGKKPVFFYRDARMIAFASEIKSLLAHPDIQVQLDPDAIPQYLVHGYVPGPSTFYRNVRQLPPGTVMAIDADGRTDVRRYWHIEFPPEREVRSVPLEGAMDGVRQRVTRAVERRLVSDVPLGAFLSGGVDSTIVVALMSRVMAEPVKTFSIGFEGDERYDETMYARLVADRFKTDHTEFRVAPGMVDLIDSLIWYHDGPFGDSSAVPTYIVSRLTREKVTVVLTGDGGDELFAGYMRFYAALVAERIPRSIGAAAQAVMASMPAPASDRHWMARAKRFVGPLGRSLEERVTSWNSVFFDDLFDVLRRDFV